MRKLKALVIWVCMGIILVSLPLLAACSSNGSTDTPATASSTAPATSQLSEKPIILKLASQNPPTFSSSISELAWAEKLKEMSNGRLQLEIYFSESLAKQNEVYKSVQTGITDIAYMTVGTDPALTNTSMVTRRVFMGLPSVRAAGIIFTDLYNKYPEIQAEWKNMKLLTSNGLPADQFYFTNKAVRVPSDMKGMKVNARGVYPEIIQAIGAAPINLNIGDWYNSAERGLVEGHVGIHFMAVYNFKLLDLYKHVTFFGEGGSDITNETHFINLDSYNKLPPDLQEILMDSCAWYEELNHKAIIEGQEEGIEAARAVGMNFANLTPDELAQWAAVAEPFDKQWVIDNSAKGNSQAIFDDCKALCIKYADVE